MVARLSVVLIWDWLTRYGSREPVGGDVTARHDLRRFAKMRASGMSFGTAVALGLGLDHARVRLGDAKPKYNGAGLAGDRDAIAGDFRRALTRAKGDDSSRG